MALHVAFTNDARNASGPRGSARAGDGTKESGPYFGKRALSPEAQTITPVMWKEPDSEIWMVGLLHEVWTSGTLLQTVPTSTALYLLDSFSDKDCAFARFNRPCEKGAFFGNLKAEIEGRKPSETLPFTPPSYGNARTGFTVHKGGRGSHPS